MKPGAFRKYAVDYAARVDYERLRYNRVQKATAQIAQDALGALLTWDEANIRSLTSYYVTTPMRASEVHAAFCARNGEPHLFGGGTPSETRRRMPWMGDRAHPSLGGPRLTANRRRRSRLPRPAPRYWGYESWNEVAPYAIGHGIGLTLHDRPLISTIKKLAGTLPRS
jgi:hypothetical protein